MVSSTSFDIFHCDLRRMERKVLMSLCGAYTICVISRPLLQSRCRTNTTGFSKGLYSENDQQPRLQLLICLNSSQASTNFIICKASINEGERWKFLQPEIAFLVPAEVRKLMTLGRLLVSYSTSLCSTIPRTKKYFSALRLLSPSNLGFSFGAMHISSQRIEIMV